MNKPPAPIVTFMNKLAIRKNSFASQFNKTFRLYFFWFPSKLSLDQPPNVNNFQSRTFAAREASFEFHFIVFMAGASQKTNKIKFAQLKVS